MLFRSFEIILLDASDFLKDDAIKLLGDNSKFLRFISSKGLSRTKSLNQLLKLSKGEVIVRLDARSSITANYLDKIYDLFKISGAEVVGGTMLPIFESSNQEIIANLMSHPLCLGGSNFRKIDYTGYVDSIYLGAYSSSFLKSSRLNYDEVHPDISEDSDLN